MGETKEVLKLTKDNFDHLKAQFMKTKSLLSLTRKTLKTRNNELRFMLGFLDYTKSELTKTKVILRMTQKILHTMKWSK